MSTHKKSRARRPGLMVTARGAADRLIEERALYIGLEPGAERDAAIERAAGAAAILHGVLPTMSRPGWRSPRNIGEQLTTEYGKPVTEVSVEDRTEVPDTAKELLGDMAVIGSGVYVEAVDMELEYA